MKKQTNLYAKWHNYEAHKTIHWIIFIAVAAGIAFLVYNRVNDPNSESYGLQSGASQTPKVNFVYLIPSDMPYNPSFRTALNKAARTLSAWYGTQLYGADRPTKGSFQFNVISKNLPHDSAYYRGTGDTWDYYVRTLEDGFALTGGGFDDPNNRWVFLNAAFIGDNQGAGGTNGVAVLHGSDLVGLSKPNNGRYVGGLGHELGHAFRLPHPPDCPSAQHCTTDLMYLGYSIFPNSVNLTAEDKNFLLTSPLVSQFFPSSNPVQLPPKKGGSFNKGSSLNSDPDRYLPASEDGILDKSIPIKSEK